MPLFNQTELTKKLKQAGFKYSLQRINKLVGEGRLTIRDGMIDWDEALTLFTELKDKHTPGQQFTKNKSDKERWLARLRELEVKEKEGKLLDRKTTEAALFKKARTVRDSLLNIPARIAPILTSLTDQLQIESLLKQEITQALKEFSSEPTNSNGVNGVNRG